MKQFFFRMWTLFSLVVLGATSPAIAEVTLSTGMDLTGQLTPADGVSYAPWVDIGLGVSQYPSQAFDWFLDTASRGTLDPVALSADLVSIVVAGAGYRSGITITRIECEGEIDVGTAGSSPFYSLRPTLYFSTGSSSLSVYASVAGGFLYQDQVSFESSARVGASVSVADRVVPSLELVASAENYGDGSTSYSGTLHFSAPWYFQAPASVELDLRLMRSYGDLQYALADGTLLYTDRYWKIAWSVYGVYAVSRALSIEAWLPGAFRISDYGAVVDGVMTSDAERTTTLTPKIGVNVRLSTVLSLRGEAGADLRISNAPSLAQTMLFSTISCTASF